MRACWSEDRYASNADRTEHAAALSEMLLQRDEDNRSENRTEDERNQVMLMFAIAVSVLVAILMVVCYAVLAIASESERKAQVMRREYEEYKNAVRNGK